MVKKKDEKEFQGVSSIAAIILIIKGLEDFFEVLPRFSEGISLGLFWDVLSPIALVWIGVSLLKHVTASK
jgi:hypothetical protein